MKLSDYAAHKFFEMNGYPGTFILDTDQVYFIKYNIEREAGSMSILIEDVFIKPNLVKVV